VLCTVVAIETRLAHTLACVHVALAMIRATTFVGPTDISILVVDRPRIRLGMLRRKAIGVSWVASTAQFLTSSTPVALVEAFACTPLPVAFTFSVAFERLVLFVIDREGTIPQVTVFAKEPRCTGAEPCGTIAGTVAIAFEACTRPFICGVWTQLQGAICTEVGPSARANAILLPDFRTAHTAVRRIWQPPLQCGSRGIVAGNWCCIVLLPLEVSKVAFAHQAYCVFVSAGIACTLPIADASIDFRAFFELAAWAVVVGVAYTKPRREVASAMIIAFIATS